MHETGLPRRLLVMKIQAFVLGALKSSLLVIVCLVMALFPMLSLGETQPAAYALSIKARVNSLPDMDAQSVDAINALLKNAVFHLQSRRDGQGARLVLTREGADLLSLESQVKGQEASLVISAKEGLSPTRVTAGSDHPPWTQLFGTPKGLLNLKNAQALLESMLGKAKNALLPLEQEAQRAVSLKAAGRSTRQQVSVLSPEEANALLSQVLPEAQALLSALPLSKESLAGLASLRFSGKQTVKRLFSNEDKEVGLSWQGNLQFAEKTHAVNLLLGWSETGLFLSLKAPARRGNDTLEAAWNLDFQQGIMGDFSARVRVGKEDLRLSGKADILSQDGEEGRGFKGQVTANLRQRGTSERTVEYTLSPDLLFLSEGFSGVLGLTASQPGLTPLEVSLVLDGQQAIYQEGQAALASVDLTHASQEEKALLQARINAALVPSFQQMLLTLPLKTRLLLLHDLGRDLRAVMPENPELAPLTQTEPSFLVEGTPTKPE